MLTNNEIAEYLEEQAKSFRKGAEDPLVQKRRYRHDRAKLIDRAEHYEWLAAMIRHGVLPYPTEVMWR